MSNKRRRERQRRGRADGEPFKSPRFSTGDGAKAYDEETIRRLHAICPGVQFVHPLGIEDTDEDLLSRARALARLHERAHGAVVLANSMTTRYFQRLVLGEAHEIHIMHTKTQDSGGHKNPFGTIIVVFKPGHQDRIENGLCPIYWERSAA